MKPPKYYRTFDYQKSLLPNYYLASLEEGVNNIQDAQEKTGLTIGYPGWGLIYYLLLSHLNPQENNIIVETGTNIGCTTIILAQALKDVKAAGHVYTVELEEANYMRALDNFRNAHVNSFITAFNCDSRIALKHITARHTNICVALLDASHLFHDVMEEFEMVLPHLADNALVIFDNTYQISDPHEDPRVHGALQEIVKRHGGNLINFEHVSWYTPGVAIWQKNNRISH
ncbi:O-methyltransferase [Trichlorobacter ammonificans]|uniref:Methyltransferase domain-containing protein n=1 Tax=Trichlorobacter ammonificans TaxID=2916410 RepID=A0ABM9D6C5_9BACT|nr:class I SAM-dependent methyltransferase [Trichlorobacter ammonificans]CAH2029933.1 protein of unknown function [Trichlorobacter ammonificans]